MQTIRAFESRVETLFKAGELPGFVHSCAGQEAIAVGVCSQLTMADYITSTHRGHGHAIAKGIALDAISSPSCTARRRVPVAGAAGRCTSPTSRSGCSGRTASWAAASASPPARPWRSSTSSAPRSPCASSVTAPSNKGTFHENLNFAGVHDLPVVFVCENNRYVEFTAASRTTAVTDISVRAASYGIVGREYRRQRPPRRDRLGRPLIARACRRWRRRRSSTWRRTDTVGTLSAMSRQYRAPEEVHESRESGDPIVRFGRRMIDDLVLHPGRHRCGDADWSQSAHRRRQRVRLSRRHTPSRATRSRRCVHRGSPG